MDRVLWEAGGGVSYHAQVLCTGNATTNLVTDAAVPAGKRIVPVWTFFYPISGGAVSSEIALQNSNSEVFFSGCGLYLGAYYELQEWGATFLDFASLGYGLQVVTANMAANTLRAAVGYYLA